MNQRTKLFGSFPDRICVRRNLLCRGSRKVFPRGRGGGWGGCKWLSYESDHTSLFSVEVKNGWMHTSTPPHTLSVLTKTRLLSSLLSPQRGPTFSVWTHVSVTVFSCVPAIKTVSYENSCENRGITEIRAPKFSTISSKTRGGTKTHGEGVGKC